MMSRNQDEHATESQREERSHRIFVATLHSKRVGDKSIIVRNISPHGISARMQPPMLEPGELVTISLNGETVDAQVRWVRRDRFGARLVREVDPSCFNFSGKSWEAVIQPFEPGHVFEQFRPVSDSRRPGLKIR
jgi:hypothetical protein